MQQRDWFMRALEQIVAAIGRVMGLLREGKIDEARLELERAYSGQLGMPLAMLNRLDASSVVTVLGPERGTLLLDLLRAEVALHEASGDARAATRLKARIQILESLLPSRRASA